MAWTQKLSCEGCLWVQTSGLKKTQKKTDRLGKEMPFIESTFQDQTARAVLAHLRAQQHLGDAWGAWLWVHASICSKA